MNGDIAAAVEFDIRMVEWARRNGDEFELASSLAALAAQHTPEQR